VAGCNNSTAEEMVNAKNETVVPKEPVKPTEPTAPAVVSALPSLPMINTLNQSSNLSQFKGKKIFVNLWATWCPPCRAEIPSIENLASKTDGSKVEFVMLSLDDDFVKAKIYAANNKMKLPVYYPTGNMPQLFNVEGIPTTFVFNENGEIIYQHTGGLNYDTKEFVEMLNK
jgi:thiol-disulfide isomerase/thioredoxin